MSKNWSSTGQSNKVPPPNPRHWLLCCWGKKPKAMLWWSPRDTVPFLGNQLNRSLFTVLMYAHIKREINVYNNQTTHFICKNHREQHENGHFYHSWTRRWSGIISVVYPLKDGTYINRAKARNSGMQNHESLGWQEVKAGNKSTVHVQHYCPPHTHTGGQAFLSSTPGPQWVHSSRLLPAQNSNQSRGLSVPPASLRRLILSRNLTPPSRSPLRLLPALPLSLPWTKGADDPSKLIRSLPTPFFIPKKTPFSSTPCFPSTQNLSSWKGNLWVLTRVVIDRLPASLSIRLPLGKARCQYVPGGQFVWGRLRRPCPAAVTKSRGRTRHTKWIITQKDRGKVRKGAVFRLIRDAF